MIEVEVSGVHQLDTAIKKYGPDVVVSAIEHQSILGVVPLGVRHLRVPIEDVYNVQLQSYKEAIRKVLATEGKCFVIHCYHGLSRSTALACVKLYQDNPDSVEPWLDARPSAEPNALILLLGDEILEADGDLLRRTRLRYKGRHL